MRGALKYGVPLAAGLAAGGYALSQGEDVGPAALAAGLGGLGGAAGLLAARKVAPQLAGKYGNLVSGLEGVASKAEEMRGNLPQGREKGIRAGALEGIANAALSAGVAAEKFGTQRNLGKVAAGGLVPASALAAGFGGVALGAIPGSLGVPGFQQGMDPEGYGSNNTDLARMSVPTMQYM
jgi:hypothetical protein